MERVLKPSWLKALVLLVCLAGCAQLSLATTAIVPPDDDMIIGARVIVQGRVLSIESRFDEQQGRIFTYIRLKVQEVLKGQITERKIVIKELGGQAGDRLSVVYGNPEFAVGEKVLVYLDTWKDGSLRTYQMFLGKFSIVRDAKTGQEFAARGGGDEHVEVLPAAQGKAGGAITDRMEVLAYAAMIKSRLAANLKLSKRFERTYHSNVPMLASPPGYVSDSKDGEIHPEYTFLNPPARWFEPDSAHPVPYTINPNPSGDAGIPALVVNPADIAAAANSWSTVPGCSLQLTYAGNLDECYTSSGTGGINVVSNNCDGRNSPTVGCAGILAWGGWSGGFFNPIVINGTTFQYRITQGFVSCNPWAACNFGDHCSVQFIVTHEMGHALGLGHSQFQMATMYAIAIQIARCAVIWTDDQDGIKFIYPGTGGGPGPLSITTTSLPGGTVGTAYSQSVLALGGTPPYTWSLVQGQGALPPGLSMSGSGVITGTPTTQGTSNFTVRVTDNVGATAQKALSILVSPSGGGGALNSQFVSQTVPTTLQPGQGFLVNLKFLNTGTQTWSGSDFFFASQNPALNQIWGGNGVSLFGFAAAPGETLDVDFTATAPSTPGTYNFQWQMYQNNGAGFFGQMSTNVAIQVGAAPPPGGTDTIGVYFPSNRTFYLRNGNSPGFADMTIQYGPAGAVPVVGDWDGNGTATIGVYDPASRTFYLRNTNSPGFADQTIQYGPAGATPIVGDWDGNGTTTIGVYDPATQTFYLRNSNTVGPADIVLQYGPPGAIPIAGDWNGDGTTTIGVYDPTSQTFYLRNSNTPGNADITIGYGPAGATPVVGDWDGNGTTTIGVYFPTNQTLYLRNSNSLGFADLTIQYGPPGAVPAVGNWDGQ